VGCCPWLCLSLTGLANGRQSKEENLVANEQTTDKCRHDGTFGQSPTGTVCNTCGADWDQILKDRPDMRPPHHTAPDVTQNVTDDYDYFARRLKEIQNDR
jgi:hypothetical protein